MITKLQLYASEFTTVSNPKTPWQSSTLKNLEFLKNGHVRKKD